MYVTSHDLRAASGCGRGDGRRYERRRESARCGGDRGDPPAARGASRPFDAEACAALVEALDREHRSVAFFEAVLARFPDAMPFAHLVEAERRHVAHLTAMMRLRGLPAPDNPHLGTAEIRRLVPASVACACSIAVEAELDTVTLYVDRFLPAVVGHEDAAELLEWLMAASRDRRLPAFRRWTAGHRFGGMSPPDTW